MTDLSTPKRTMSVFDLDQTLIRGNSGYLFSLHLFREKVFSLWTILLFTLYYGLHRMKLLSVRGVYRLSLTKISNIPSSVIQDQVQKYLDQTFKSSQYRPAVRKLNEAKKAGHFTAIISSSPDFLVEAFAERFGVDDWGATTYSKSENNGRLKIDRIMIGEEKAVFVNYLANKNHIEESNIIAYSDSYLDLPFLKAAGIAVGVNPDKALFKICQENDWLTI